MKNGFTMIELLAVITILGVIALIITPVVVNYISTTKSTAYLINIDKLLNASKIYYQNYKLENNTNAIGESYDEILKIAKGEKPDNGVIYFNGKGDIALSVKYKDYCYVKNFYSEEVIIEKEDVCSIPFDYMMKAEENVSETSNFLNGPMKRNEIESIKTLNYIDVVDSIGEWDVSEKQNGTVMAWYKDEDGDNLYEVYIGSNDIVRTNPDATKLFAFLHNLTDIDLSNIDTSITTNMLGMFGELSNLEILDVSKLNTSNVTNMRIMFGNNYNTKLKEIIGIENFDTRKVTNMTAMFQLCQNLRYLYLNNFDTSNVTDMSHMFYGCENLLTLNIENFDTRKVTNMQTMFYNCVTLTSLDLSSFDTSNVTNMLGMFSGGIYSEATSETNSEMALEKIIGIEEFNTSNVINMYVMFRSCRNLKTLDLSKWNTSKVTNMAEMFRDCSNLTTLVFGENFKTDSVENMSSMFADCFNLTELDLSNFNTSNVKYMGNFDFKPFENSDIIHNLIGMFANCTNLITINLSNATFDNVTSYDEIFLNTSSLKEIIVKDINSQEFIKARLADISKTGVTVTIANS